MHNVEFNGCTAFVVINRITSSVVFLVVSALYILLVIVRMAVERENSRIKPTNFTLFKQGFLLEVVLNPLTEFQEVMLNLFVEFPIVIGIVVPSVSVEVCLDVMVVEILLRSKFNGC